MQTSDAWNVPIRLDDDARAALADLTGDGTPIAETVRTAITEAASAAIAEAVRTAITKASARRTQQPASDESDATDTDLTYEEWVEQQALAAPPLSDSQIHLLKTAFVEERIVHQRQRERHKTAECRAPNFWSQPLDPSEK